MIAHSYEDLAHIGGASRPELLEAYKGADIVAWHGKVERQLSKFIDDYVAAANPAYVDKLREFLKIWRENEITGSINREDIETLLSATEMLAVDTWRLRDYFSNLRDQLRRLRASVEELPTLPDDSEYSSMRGAVRDVPPTQMFGPEKKAKPSTPAANGAEAPAAVTPEPLSQPA